MMNIRVQKALRKLANSAMQQAMQEHQHAVDRAGYRNMSSNLTPRSGYQWGYIPSAPTYNNSPMNYQPPATSNNSTNTTQQQQQQQPQTNTQQSESGGGLGILGGVALTALGGLLGYQYGKGGERKPSGTSIPVAEPEYRSAHDQAVARAKSTSGRSGFFVHNNIDSAVAQEQAAKGGHVAWDPKHKTYQHRMGRQELIDFYNKNSRDADGNVRKPYKQYGSAEAYADKMEQRYRESAARVDAQRAPKDRVFTGK